MLRLPHFSRSAIGLSLLVVLLFAAFVTYGLVNTPAQFQGSGTVNVGSIGLEVYSDAGLVTVLQTVNWGTLQPGGSSSVDVWVKNTGTIAVTLSMLVDNWVPGAAGSQISVSWDYDGSVLSAGLAEHVRFTLTVNPAISGVATFSHDITIMGV